MSFVPSSASFRFPIAWQCFFPLVALILTLGLPETPRVLYYWNQLEEADRELSRLFAVQGVPESNEITATEKRNILAAIRFEKEETNSGPLWKSLFWDNSPVRNSRRLAIAVIMQALQQLGRLRHPSHHMSMHGLTLFKVAATSSRTTKPNFSTSRLG